MLNSIKYLVLVMFLFSSCYEEIPDLEINPLEDDSIEFLKILNHNYDPQIGRLTVNFEVNYDIASNSDITAVSVIKNGTPRFSITDPSQRFFVESNLSNGNTVCYRLAFLTADGERTKQTEDNYCIDL